MDSRLKQRLIGAVVLVALAVIFLPMLVQGPAPDSGVSDVPLTMPAAPRNDYETRDLPLVSPADAPVGGAVGMAAAPPAVAPIASPSPAAATPLPDSAAAPPPAPSASGASNSAAASGDRFPATVAGGDYAVNFGSYATQASADAAVASLRASQLPGYREQAAVNGKSIWRVRVGPYASQAAAEAARLRAGTVHGAAGARVIALDAPPARSSVDATRATAAASTVMTKPSTATPVVSAATPAPATATSPSAVTSAAPSVGFAVQLAAFSKAADATTLRDKLQAAGFSAFTESVNTDHGTLIRVRAGPVQTHAQADQLQTQIKSRLGLDGVVRPHP
jgi:cell division septation protein DedD